MNHISKSIYLTLIFSLTINFSFSQERHTLELRLNAEGKIVDPEEPLVRRYDTVLWVIRDPNIVAFAIKGKGKKHIFTSKPDRDQAAQLELVIAYGVKLFGGKWEYNIEWTDRNNQIRDHDPKIAVKPIIDLSNPIFLLAFLINLYMSFVFYRKWQNTEKQLKSSHKIHR